MTDQLAWLLTAISLVLVIEGLLPAISPKRWKELLDRISTLSDIKTRIMGVFLMLTGAICIAMIHNF